MDKQRQLSDMTLEELWQLFPIELMPHNPMWRQTAAGEIKVLHSLLARFKPLINHIGSTAIPAISAKPIIDILVEVPVSESRHRIRTILEQNGYICMSSSDRRVSFNKGYTQSGYAEHVFHIHVGDYGDNDEILFRDFLIAHPDEALKYETLKQSLLPQFRNNRDAYTEAKTDFIKRITALARYTCGTKRHAVLFVHGILGSPSFFSFLQPVIPPHWHIESITLQGHCAEARDFGQASMKQWKTQVSEKIDELARKFHSIVVVAHSMGTLFAIREALDHKIDALLLLNPPLGLHLSRRLFTSPLKVLSGSIKHDDVWANAAREAYSIAHDSNPMHYIAWPARYIELFAEIIRTRPLAARIDVPVHVFYSAHDEMVSAKSATLFADTPLATLHTLHDSGHYYYTDTDKLLISEALASLCASIS